MHRRQITRSKPDVRYVKDYHDGMEAMINGFLASYDVTNADGDTVNLLDTMAADSLVEELTGIYCESMEHIPFDKRPTGRFMANKLVMFERKQIARLNGDRSKADRIPMPSGLSNYQVVDLLILSKHFANIVFAEDASDDASTHLAVYVEHGPNMGTWSISEREISRAIWDVSPEVSAKGVAEIMDRLRSDDDVPTVERESNPDLIPMQNGLFDYRTKRLHAFSPEHVFLAKSHTRWNPNARDVEILMPDGRIFSVDRWMSSLSDDPEIVQLLWEGVSAALRPHVAWNKVMMLFSESGNNGKGTYCKMLRNLLGKGTVASIPLANFDKDFMLESLITAQSVVTDENSIGTFLQDAANFKAIVTHDPICVNRKHKQAVTVQFDGFMLQCFNELPRTRDKTDSIYRRLLFVPMDKCFTGREVKEIKSDYLNRPEVLEYIAYRALMSDFYEFSNPEASQEALEEFKSYNDPVREFYNEVLCDQGTLDAYSWELLYQLYLGYMREKNPNGKPQSYRTFTDDMAVLVNRSTAWCLPQGDRHKQFRVNDLMVGFEPLILRYDVRRCMREGAKPGTKESATDIYPDHRSRIRGIYRKVRGNGTPVGRAGHLAQGGGTDSQPVTRMSVPDVRRLADGTLRMASGAPVPDDVRAELDGTQDVPLTVALDDPEAIDVLSDATADVEAGPAVTPDAREGVAPAVPEAADDVTDGLAGNAADGAGTPITPDIVPDDTPDRMSPAPGRDAGGDGADAPSQDPMSMAVVPTSFPERHGAPGLEPVSPDDDDLPALRLFDDDDDDGTDGEPGLHLVKPDGSRDDE